MNLTKDRVHSRGTTVNHNKSLSLPPTGSVENGGHTNPLESPDL